MLAQICSNCFEKGDSPTTFPVTLHIIQVKATCPCGLRHSELSFALKGYLTLLGSVGISHVNQSDWDDKTLAGGSAAYGNRSRCSCLRIHSTDGVL